MAISPDWEMDVWEQRVENWIDVDELEDRKDLKEYLDWKLPIVRKGRSWSQQKGTLLKHIDKSSSYRDIEKAMKTRLVKSTSLSKLKATLVAPKAIELIDVKINKALRKEGKITTVFRNEIRRATSRAEIEEILVRAKEELGVGENYESLVEGAKDILEGL